jgi:hypothetical protein
MSKVKVRCTLEVEIEWPDEPTPEEFESREDWINYRLVENSCPGTGLVGAAIDDAIAYGEEHGFCWACNLKGTNEIIP